MAQEEQKSLIKLNFNEEQVKLIKDLIAPESTDTELQLFLYQAKRTGLDPLARQLFFIKRKYMSNGVWKSKVSIQTSIDGFRVVAERNGSYAGQDEPKFEEDNNGKPTVCRVAVYRFGPNGERYQASVGVAYWAEYFPGEKEGFMWKKMPHTMLAKVAEALALRKAFPQDLSGLYSEEEMEQSEAQTNTGEPKKEIEAPKKTTAKGKRAKKSTSTKAGEVGQASPAIEGEVVETPPVEVPDSPQRQAKLKWVKALVEQNKIPMADYENYTDEQLADVMADYRKTIGK